MVKISELRSRDVVNISDGKKLGYVKDIELDLVEGFVTALVLPGEFKILFRSEERIIPWSQIEKIGDDVILVKCQEMS